MVDDLDMVEPGPVPGVATPADELRIQGPRRRIRTAVLVAGAFASVLYAWFGPTPIRRDRWVAHSREALPPLAALLAVDPRFADLDLGVLKSGEVVVQGTVRCEADRQDLQALLTGMTFPHGALLHVFVE